MTWTLHVEEDFSSAHHNGPPGHKCNETHGHDWLAIVEITYDKVDEIGWGPDFGGIKAIIKPLDHNDLNKLFDGTLGHFAEMKPSAENIAKWLWGMVDAYLKSGRNAYFEARIDFVTICEGGANRVTYRE